MCAAAALIVDPAAVVAAAVSSSCCCVDVVADTAIPAVDVVVACCCYCCCSCYCYIEALSPPETHDTGANYGTLFLVTRLGGRAQVGFDSQNFSSRNWHGWLG